MNLVSSKKVETKNKSKTQNLRESNIELLRIVATIFILVYHYVTYGGILEINIYSLNKLLALFLSVEGKVGVGIFLIITGYFMANSKFKIKKVLKFCFQVFFYSTILAFIAIDRSMANLKETDISAYFMPILKNVYWFPSVYIGVYVSSQLINKFLKSLGKENCKKFLIIAIILISIFPTFLDIDVACNEFNFAVLMYAIGAYIKLYSFEFKHKKTSLCIAILQPIISYLYIILAIVLNKKLNTQLELDWFLDLYSTIGIVGAVGYFMLFKNLKIKQSRIINYISKISFATYLLSDHQMYKHYFWYLDCKTDAFLYANIFVFAGHVLLCVVGIYVAVAIIEFVRVNLLEKPLFKIRIFDKYLDRFDNWMNSVAVD